MEFLYVRVTFLHTGVSIFAHPLQILAFINKTKNTNIVKYSNIFNKNCNIMDENLKHV